MRIEYLGDAFRSLGEFMNSINDIITRRQQFRQTSQEQLTCNENTSDYEGNSETIAKLKLPQEAVQRNANESEKIC